MAGIDNSVEIPAPAIANKTISAGDLNRVALAPGFEEAGSFVQRALEHVRSLEGFAGLPAEFEADPRASRTSAGAVTVHLRQQFKSIPVFLAAETVRFAPTGEVESATGSTFNISEDTPVEPLLGPEQATLAAAEHAASIGQALLGEEDEFGSALEAPALDLSDFKPEVVAAFPEFAARPTILAPGPFGHHIKASLIWFPGGAALALGWEVILTMPGGAGQYRVIVDARSGNILYSRQLIDLLIARGSVYREAGPPNERETVEMPPPWSDYAAGFDPEALPASFGVKPPDWFEEGAGDTFGRYVRARLGDSGPPLAGQLDNGVLVFQPQGDDGDDQKVLNIFYYNSWLHDLFYLLGFREEDGSFGGSHPADPVDARAHSGSVWGTANMLTPPAGSSPTMNMGLVTSTNRHTAFDASVVFHEYMHGVTNRLVGGPMNTHALETPQSKAMGEGWGDYLACTLSGKTTVGDWVTQKPGGIRSHPYDENYPGTYGQIGTGIYTQVHRVGEIWCATLLALNRNLNAKLGSPRGQRLALQLVVDALKLSPANPNMLDMRDSILRAFDQLRSGALAPPADQREEVLAAIWAAFARFGMGVNARSEAGDFGNITEDFTPGVAIPAEDGPRPGTGTGTGTGNGPVEPTQPGSVETVRLQDRVAVEIPDADPDGLRRSLRVDRAGRVRSATVKLDISHPYAGDLVIRLTPPGRQPIMLHNREFHDTSEFNVEFTTANRLSSLINASASGDWVLTVADMAENDVGSLREWSLEIEVDPSAAADEPAGFAAEGNEDLAEELRRLAVNLADVAERLGRIRH